MFRPTVAVLLIATAVTACSSYAQKKDTPKAAAPVVAAPAAPQAPIAADAKAAEPAGPKLTEVLELKRQNAVYRASALSAKVESIQASIQREQAEIKILIDAVRAEVERSYPGWTLGDNLAVTAKKK